MPLSFNEVGESIMLCAQFSEDIGGYVIDQAIFQGSGGKTHLVTAQQTGLTEEVAFDKSVIEFAIAPVNLHRTATDIVQVMNDCARFKDVTAGLEITHFYPPGDGVYRFLW